MPTIETVRGLAAYVATAREQDLAAPLREAACRAVLDLIAATMAGASAPGPRAVRRTACATLAGGAHPLWFSGQMAGLAAAIWCNGSAAAALDLDDGHRIARGHPGAAVIPAAIAGAAETGASTEDLLRAIVVGYEVGVAVGAARRFYANTGMWSGYGVVAALGYLRRTPQEALANAFAIAGISAPNQLHAGAGPVFPALEGSDVKEGIGWSNLTAVHALLLAEAGHTGPLALLDHDAHFRLDGLVAGLGRHAYITRNYMKFHACCRHVHGPVEALLDLIARHGLDPRRIDFVTVETYSGALRISNRVRPWSPIDIQFSIPYCLGLVALDGPDALLPVADAAVDRPDVAAFAERVALLLDPELDAQFPARTLSRVTVRSGGRDFVSAPTAPRGEADAPPTWQALEDKLRKASRFVATQADQDRVLDAARHLQDGDHQPLLDALATTVLSPD
jgi:2-methylcitrate dehydratase PrpD